MHCFDELIIHKIKNKLFFQFSIVVVHTYYSPVGGSNASIFFLLAAKKMQRMINDATAHNKVW